MTKRANKKRTIMSAFLNLSSEVMDKVFQRCLSLESLFSHFYIA